MADKHFNEEAPEVTVHSDDISDSILEAFKVEAIHYSLGANPGTAMIVWTGDRAAKAPYLIGNRVGIKLGGDIVFAGWILEQRNIEKPTGTSVELNLYDSRWLLQRHQIGDPDHPDFVKIGADVIFNRGGRPDMGLFEEGEGEESTLVNDWYRNNQFAIFWTLGSIMDKVGTYINQFSDIIYNPDRLVLGGAGDDTPGEMRLVGMNIAEAFDQVISASGVAQWALDYETMEIYSFHHDSPINAEALEFKYMTDDSEVDTTTAVNWTDSYSLLRTTNRVIAMPGPAISESSWQKSTGDLIQDRSYNSPNYVSRYIPNWERYGDSSGWLGLPEKENSHGKPFHPTALTRILSGIYQTAVSRASYPNRGNPVDDEDQVMFQSNTGQWYRGAGAGYQIEDDPPAFYIKDKISVWDVTVAGSATGDTIDLEHKDIVDFRINVTTRTDFFEYRAIQNEPAPVAGGYRPSQILWMNELQNELRYKLTLPGLDPNFPSETLLPIDEEIYFDRTADLSLAAENFLKLQPNVHREITFTLPRPWIIKLGQWGVWKSSEQTEPPGTEVLIVVGVDIYFSEVQNTIVRLVNQIGSEIVRDLPLASKETGDWRYSVVAEQAKERKEARIKERMEEVGGPSINPAEPAGPRTAY